MNIPPQADPATPLQVILSRDQGTRGRARLWQGLLLLGALGLAVWAYDQFYLRSAARTGAPQYRTEAVTLGDLVLRVSATGHLQPTNQVDVGSELSGIVETVLTDDNDRVARGQVLVRLDTAKLRDTVAKSHANLASAQAQLLLAQATLVESRAQLARFKQVAKASGGKVPSQSELEAAEADLKRAEANEAVARASIAQAQAGLQSDETNLTKAQIRSPIDGVVLSRKVEPGQTVAASLQAPVLFTLAEDLAKMELQVSVDEADVGRVQAGQQATFSVDAWPGRQYRATIRQVSFGAEEENGVVSYPTVLEVNNDDLSLRPGMTSTAEIITLTRTNVPLIPNAALRFTPAGPDTAKKAKTSLISTLMPRPPRQTPRTRPASPKGAPRVWVLREGQAVPITVHTGISDGKYTELLDSTLTPGVDLITERLDSAS